MKRRCANELRMVVAASLASLLACPPSNALVALNDGRDRIYVSGTLSASHDSNVRANREGPADMIYSTSVVAEYTRRAGWIGVDGRIGLDSAEFAELKDENYNNPNLRLGLTKQSGRTTGALNLSAARESRADAAVNVRSNSWNYAGELKYRYPLAGAYTFTGSFGYDGREYIEDIMLANLYSYTASLEVVRGIGRERDAMAAYRYRYNKSSFDSSTLDHAITLGLSGRLLRGVKGALRAGYQVRSFRNGVEGDGTFGSWTASASVTHALSKRASISAQLSKDFSTTANDSSVDVTATSVNGQYAFGARLVATASGSWGRSRFLGERGRVLLALGPPPVLGPSRVDNYATWDAGLNFTLKEHLKLALTYLWFRNWSTSSYADFVRESWTVSVSSRW